MRSNHPGPKSQFQYNQGCYKGKLCLDKPKTKTKTETIKTINEPNKHHV